MVSAAIVNRYANALVSVVLADSGIKPSDAVHQLRNFEAVAKGSPDLGIVLASPAVSMPRKRAVIRGIAGRLGLAPIIRNFLLVLSDHRRMPALTQVVDAFELALDERLGYVHAQVRSAFELNEHQRNHISQQLGKLAGGKVRMRFEIEPDLIGGVTARIGSTVYDGSVRGRLAAMRQRLAAVQR